MKKIIIVCIILLVTFTGASWADENLNVTINLNIENPDNYQGEALIIGWGITGPPSGTEVIKNPDFPMEVVVHAVRKKDYPAIYVTLVLAKDSTVEGLRQQQAGTSKFFMGNELKSTINYTAVLAAIK